MADKIVTLTRDQIVRNYIRDYQFRAPDADVSTNSLPWIDANTFADQQMLLMHDAEIAGAATGVRGLRGDRLIEYGKARGLKLLPATGSSGYVEIVASDGGTTLFAGDELTDPVTSLRFKCVRTALYVSGAPVPILGVDTGPSTNLAADTKLQWVNQRLGCALNCTVLAQTNGDGLSGGHDPETEEEFIERIEDHQANPPAMGNSAALIEAGERVPGVPVEKMFVMPGIVGSGTTAFVFTTRESTSGSRVPNDVQIGLVEASLVGQFAGDDGIMGSLLVEVEVPVVLTVTWAKGIASWADVTPWPAYASTAVHVDGAVAPTATAFRLTTSVDTTTPQVGQTFALWDATTRSFKKKRIGTVVVVVANRSWTITCDTTNGASDPAYVPVAGQMASPWSDSLDLLAPALRSYFKKLGPGEQVATFPDPGARKRRSPEPPAWPSTITNRLLTPIHALTSITDADLMAPTVPYVTPVGTPGVQSNLIIMGDLAVYKQ